MAEERQVMADALSGSGWYLGRDRMLTLPVHDGGIAFFEGEMQD